ncbi:hypothetical protein BOX15_Mlig033054g1 [Macrostomum lignano]|uniref:non-specific serine/threonine protein kinase n=1 Tax=Macrostomum lignano TaxID=282301 RepID=A0A267F3J7_9PLAT|nr:hypothetical protein BOX15_Mlig033054g1 [Macrostomum lignano]
MQASANSNNSAVRIFVLEDVSRPSDTGRVGLTTEPELFAAMQQPEAAAIHVGQRRRRSPAELQLASMSCSATHNALENLESEQLDTILRTIYEDKEFNRKYNYSSLFLIGSGSYGCVFRIVSNASGKLENPLYDEQYVRFLQTMRRTKSRKKSVLLDAYRDSLCLDLVAMKVEALSLNNVSFMAANQIQLVKEFCILTELFRNSCSTNALVGFPMPIEFGFLGNKRVAKNLKKVLIFDTYGRPNNYHEALMGTSTILNLSPGDVTDLSYMTMELLGPNLDEWKVFFSASHGRNNKLVFSVQTTLKLMDQFLCRLIIMHQKNIVHLDLKPDNLCMGIGKMTNTVYLLDYGLSRICSENKPDITMGSRRYMSVGVLNLEPANYMMDIESWFYILIVLLTDFIPWSDEELSCQLGKNEKEGGAREEKLLVLVSHTKKQFWGDDNYWDKNIIQKVVDKIEAYHKAEVPDIARIIMDIYEHVKKMRQDFYKVSYTRMNADIKDEESDLFKRYKTLRKLLLFPYDCDFTAKGSCFANDKDIQRKQEERKAAKHHMLIYAEDGRNWHWDWDLWYAEDFGADDGHCSQKVTRPPGQQFNCSNRSNRKRSASSTQRPQQQQQQPRCVSDDYDIEDVLDYGLVKVKPSS